MTGSGAVDGLGSGCWCELDSLHSQVVCSMKPCPFNMQCEMLWKIYKKFLSLVESLGYGANGGLGQTVGGTLTEMGRFRNGMRHAGLVARKSS